MKKYYIEVINLCKETKYVIIADSYINCSDDTLHFLDIDNDLIAQFPRKYTIVYKIEQIK